MMIFDRSHDHFGRIPAVQLAAPCRTVRMDGDGNLVGIDQLVQTIEAVRARVSTKRLDAERFAELEEFLVGIVALGEALHPVSDGLDIVVRAESQEGLDLIRRAIRRSMLLEEFDEVQPQLLGALEGRFGGKIPEAIALRAHDEAAERIGNPLGRAKQSGKPSASDRTGGARLEKAAPTHLVFLMEHHCGNPLGKTKVLSHVVILKAPSGERQGRFSYPVPLHVSVFVERRLAEPRADAPRAVLRTAAKRTQPTGPWIRPPMAMGGLRPRVASSVHPD